MLLFIISFLLVFVSSYFITSVISPKKSIVGLFYLFIIVFAQLVLTFEILSLLNAIKQVWVLSANVIFFLASAHVWHRKSRPCWSVSGSDLRNRVLNSFKLDRSLAFLYVGFCVFIISALILCAILPITNADAYAYHVARSLFWVLNGNMNFYGGSEIRALCLPINSEILYAWVLLFLKSDVFLGFFSFVGYFVSMVACYNILGLLGYCTRKRLWVIFIVSSFASVIVQASGTETDILIAGLVSTSVFLYWYALKNNKITPIFMSALAYALAIGTKTPSIFAIPGIGLFLLGLTIYYKKKDFAKPLGLFLGFGVVNFIIFASFNYVQNFINFGNFMGASSFIEVSKNYYGIKGMFANFIKHIFLFFDFTGLRWSDYVGQDIVNIRFAILKFFHLAAVPDGLYSADMGANRTLLEPVMGAGVLGLLVYFPCLCFSLLYPIFKHKSMKVWCNFGYAIFFVLSVLIMSNTITFMVFSVRFIMFFIVVSSPILVYSYFKNKNPLKYVIVGFSLFYLVFVSNHLWPRPLFKILRFFYQKPSISYIRDMAACSDYTLPIQPTQPNCVLRNYIRKNYSTDNRLAFFLSSSNNIFLLKILEFEGYKLDFLNLEDAKNIDFNKYNAVIMMKTGQGSTYFKDYEKRKNEVKLEKGMVILKKGDTVPCIYMKNPRLYSKGRKSEIAPYRVTCAMTREFLQEKNLQMFKFVGIASTRVGIVPYIFDSNAKLPKEDFDYYVIYRNLNRPIKYKTQK